MTTGKWEKFLSDMAVQRDEAERTAKSERFMSGIRRFSTFLVEAAKNGPRDVRFEKEAPAKRKAAKRTSARGTGAKKAGGTQAGATKALGSKASGAKGASRTRKKPEAAP